MGLVGLGAGLAGQRAMGAADWEVGAAHLGITWRASPTKAGAVAGPGAESRDQKEFAERHPHLKNDTINTHSTIVIVITQHP